MGSQFDGFLPGRFGLKVVKVILLLLTLLFLAGSVLAVEQPCLQIDVNQNWQGTIELDRPVVVLSNVQLEIAPGTLIKIVKKNAGIKVEGSLLAHGTTELPIRLDAPQGWSGIEFSQATEPSHLENLSIGGAEVGVAVSQSRLDVSTCSFRGCTTAIKLDRQAVVQIVKSEFVDNQTAVDIGTRSQGNLREIDLRVMRRRWWPAITVPVLSAIIILQQISWGYICNIFSPVPYPGTYLKPTRPLFFATRPWKAR